MIFERRRNMNSLNCYIHPGTMGTASCEKCHQKICVEDHRMYQLSICCPTCYKTRTKQMNKYILAVIIFAILAYGSLFLAMVLYKPHIKIAHILAMILNFLSF